MLNCHLTCMRLHVRGTDGPTCRDVPGPAPPWKWGLVGSLSWLHWGHTRLCLRTRTPIPYLQVVLHLPGEEKIQTHFLPEREGRFRAGSPRHYPQGLNVRMDSTLLNTVFCLSNQDKSGRGYWFYSNLGLNSAHPNPTADISTKGKKAGQGER